MSSEGYAGALARRGWTIGRNQRWEVQARFPVLGDLAAYLARRGLHEIAEVSADVLDALSPPEVLALFVVRFGKGGLP